MKPDSKAKIRDKDDSKFLIFWGKRFAIEETAPDDA
jgi:hypothetical protein